MSRIAFARAGLLLLVAALTAGAAVRISTRRLPDGVVGVSYSAALDVTGAKAPVVWSIATGSLPPGLTLGAGQISGTPTAAGSFPFTVQVVDSDNKADTQGLSINIVAPISITTSSLPYGVVGVAYSQTLGAAGGTPPYTWSVAGGSLPPGLSLSGGGAVSGTPSAAGSYSFSAKVTDSTSASATQSLSITVNAPALSVTTTSLPPGTVGTAYNQTLSATGGTPPYTWAAAGGSLPPGLTLSDAGAISGTPTTAGSYSFSAKVTDNTSASATQSLSITVNAPALSVTTTSLPPGTVGSAYNQTLGATGGTPPYTWSLAGGSLPPGLSLSGSGGISGTATTAGSYSFSAKVTDSTSASATQSLSITVNAPALSVTTTSLPPGTVGTAYNQTLGATGGTPPYTWIAAGGSLPPGLTLSGAGAISGTPTTAGTYSFSAKVTDSTDASATQALGITVNASTLAIATTSLPSGTVGQAYNQTLAANGGTPPYTWSVTSGSLPAGVSLSSSGTLSGVPSAAGSASFTVRATDAASVSVTQALNVTIAAAPIAIATVSLPGGTVGASYSQTLSATGGTQPYSWSIAFGALPAGVSVSSAGVISGTPSASGTAFFTVKVTSASGTSATQALSIAVGDGLSVASCPAGVAVFEQPYNSSASATGGTAPYTWSVSAGQLPAGLSLAAGMGVVSGTPAAAGNFSFTLRVTDSASASGTQLCSIAVSAPLSIVTSSLSGGVQGAPYTQSLTATGGQPPYTWSLASGSLPAGLTLGSSGQIGGTPTAAVTAMFTVGVRDNAGTTATRSLSIGVTLGLAVSTCPTATGIVGQAYTSAATATGGATPYSWSVSAGALPPGLSLSAGGTLSGTPSTAGSYNFTVQAQDAASTTSVKPCSVSINAALTITTAALANAAVSGSYTQQLSAAGGSPPYSWSIVSGSLPPGLSLNSSTGQITGTATTAGTYSFTLRVSDTTSAVATKAVSLNVIAGLAVRSCPAGSAATGRNYSSTLGAAGGQPPYAWTISAGQLPSGLSLDASSGVIAGIPSTAGNADFTLGVTDRGGTTAQLACTITVGNTLTITSTTLPDGTLRAPYSAPLGAAGGTAPYSWSTTAGSLPPGLTLNSPGAITGTPTAAGTFNFTLHVTDALLASADQPVSITIAAGLTIPSCPIPLADAGSAYSSDLSAIGGAAPYAWSIGTGALPAGLGLDPASGRVSGTPVQAGASSFGLHVVDAANRTVDRACTITVAASLTISTASLPDAVVGTPYSETLSGTGGTPPYAWSSASGSLPPGLFLNSASGQITGTPTVAGTYQFTVRLSDSSGTTVSQQLTLIVSAGLTISACPASIGVVGQSYSATVGVQGGKAPFGWSLQAGALPAGLTLDAKSGAISGVPAQIGVSSYTLSVVDAAAASASRACTLTIYAAGGLSISTGAALVPAVVGTPYSVDLAVSGGSGPYTWKVVDGSLPDGLTLDTAGALKGTPSQAGSYQFALQATDKGGAAAVQTFTLNVLVAAPPSIVISGLTDFVQPAQQPAFGVALSAGYPAALQGTLTLAFTPDPGLGVDDPAIKFANGSRTMTFSVAAGQTAINFATPALSLQTGTVAGTIQVTVTLQADGADIGPLSGAQKAVRVDRLAPKITNVAATKTATGVQLEITGYATTRDLSQATFQFGPTAGGTPAQVTVPLTDSASRWFGDTASWKFGGEFKFTIPFTMNPSDFNSVSITLTGGPGVSGAASVNF